MNVINGLRFIFFPPFKCALCGREFKGSFEMPLCEDCFSKLQFAKRRCLKCGRELLGGGHFCITCKNHTYSFDSALSPLVYDGDVKKLIHLFKYRDLKSLGEFLAKFMADEFIARQLKVDAVVYVPMTVGRFIERGYNQTKILAKHVSKRVGIEVLRGAIKKVKKTKRQAGLSRAMREKNLAGSFKVLDRQSVSGKDILIVDDVLTTGATAGEIARTLKAAGAKRVYVLTAAATKEIIKFKRGNFSKMRLKAE